MKICRNPLTLLMVLALSAACNQKPETAATSAQPPVADQKLVIVEEQKAEATPTAGDSTQNSVDWEGTYTGVIPCASCEGISMALTLNADNTYNLEEEYLGKQEEPLSSVGKFTWQADGSTIALQGQDENRKFFVGESFVEMLWGNGKPSEGESEYVLTKVGAMVEESDTFAGKDEQLRLHLDTLSRQPDDTVADKVAFTATWDFYHPTQAGHRSLVADFDIDCNDNRYTMRNVTYYKDHNGKGKVIDKAANTDAEPIPLAATDDSVSMAADAYCGGNLP